MITRYGLYLDFFKARFYDIQLPKPDCDEYKSKPIVLTDELLAEWESKATEIVKCEPFDYAEWYRESADSDAHFPLNILRIQHEDGTFSVEPVYKLFPIKRSNHIMLCNSLLEYCDVEKDLAYTADFNEKQMNAPARQWIPEWGSYIMEPSCKRLL